MTSEQQKLAEDNIKFATWKAKEWAKTQKHIPLDELISISQFALTKAAATYNPDKKTTFATYASFVINNDIKTELRKLNKTKSISYEYLAEAQFDLDPETQESLSTSINDVSTEFKLALNQLTEQERIILLEFYNDGYSQREIAARHNLSQTKVSLICQKARESLRAYLDA